MKSSLVISPDNDPRYSIDKEFCGHPYIKFVLRFCGDFISSHDSLQQAEAARSDHNIRRM